ncbi:MAG: glycosyltransferase family 39 protein, partial [Planctomycetota bacterium]
MTDADPSRAHTGRRFRRAARSPLAGAALVIICLVAYLPGLFTMPPVDRDESRFAQATRQMVEGVREADSPAEVIEALAVPMIQDRPRLNKPPLVYWVQAIPAGVLGLDRAERDIGRAWFGAALPTGNIGAFRVASVFCSILAVVFTWRLGLRLFEPRTAFVAAALLGTCIMVLWDARQARADQLLLACTAASMWALAATWRRPRPTSRSLALA